VRICDAGRIPAILQCEDCSALAMSENRSESAGVKIPPPLVFAGGLILGLVIGVRAPLVSLPPWPARTAGVILLAGGLILGGWARFIFLRRGTSVRPDRPVTALVLSGPFRITRNPMYVGISALYAGIALLCRSVWPLLLLPLVLLVVQRTAIDREEAHMERRFGAEYRNYKARVRRWL